MKIASPYDGHPRTVLRFVLAAVLAFDTLLAWHALATVHPSAASHPHAPAWLLAFAGHPWAAAPFAVTALVALAAFARRPALVVPGWIALAAVGWIVEAHAAAIEGPYRIFFSGGAAMLGWLVAATYARAVGREPEDAERFAEMGAAAGLAATYVNAVASKMLAGGVGWIDADSLRAIVLTQHHVNASGISAAYAAAIADHASLAGTLVLLTLIAQASALAYPWHPAARAVSGTLLLAFHANTAILTPLFFPEAMVLLAALSYPWPAIVLRLRGGAPAARGASPGTAPARPVRTVRAALIGALLAGALVAWTSPLRSYTLVHHSHGSDAAPALPAALAAALADLQPGARVGPWQVRSCAAAANGARLELTSGPRVLHVLVVPHGSVPVPPPATTRDYDLLYVTGRPDEPTVTGDEAAGALGLVAAAIRERE
ncbi:MAG TPA: hypothetical protein VF765_26835 [Polyangiaceae bacterium]